MTAPDLQHPPADARGDRGASLVEYALLVALIAVVCIGALRLVGDRSSERFEDAGKAVGRTEVLGEVVLPPGGGPAPGPVDPGPSDPGPVDPGPSDPGPSDPGPVDPGPVDPGPADPGPVDPGPGSGGPAPAPTPQTAISPAGTQAGIYWWDSHGKSGQWVAGATFENAWIRHAYLTLEVTRVYGDGRRTVSQVSNFYVPAGGSATYEHWSNDLKDNGTARDDVVTVEVRVVSVRTSDESWQSVTHDVTLPPVKVTAPAMP